MFNPKNQFTNLTAFVCMQAQKAYCVLSGLKFCENPCLNKKASFKSCFSLVPLVKVETKIENR